MTNEETTQEIINRAKRGVRTSVELGQVTGNSNIIDLLMVVIHSGIKEALDSQSSQIEALKAEVARMAEHNEVLTNLLWSKSPLVPIKVESTEAISSLRSALKVAVESLEELARNGHFELCPILNAESRFDREVCTCGHSEACKKLTTLRPLVEGTPQNTAKKLEVAGELAEALSDCDDFMLGYYEEIVKFYPYIMDRRKRNKEALNQWNDLKEKE